MSPQKALICLKCSLLCVFLLFLQPAFAQYNFSELDQSLQDNQKVLGNDLVAMVWKGDSLVYKKEFGTFNSKTVAPLGAASKWLTAAVVMKLVDEGKISLDDPVVKYIPVFEKYFKSYITIRQCLSHMTGIADEGNFLTKFFQRKKFASLEEEVNYLASKDIRANPGKDFWYGNIGLNIAGRVIEVVTRKKFDLLIKTKLFVPLEMRKTTFSTLDVSAIDPSGGAQSTAEDYMKFMVMLLNKGKYKGVQILSENSIAEMMTVYDKPDQIKYSPDATEGFTYALGSWVIEQKDMKASAVVCPSLFGTWPVIDFCRGYASLIFSKTLSEKEKTNEFRSLKKIIDKQLPSTCQ